MESIFKLGILLSVVDKVTGPTSRISGGMDTLKGKVASLGPSFDKFKTYGLRVATVGALMLHMLSGAVMATVDTQKALGELSSVGVQDLGALEKAGAAFSGQWAGTTKAQFIGAAYDIKSGISTLTDTGVAEFTKLAAITGKATKSTTAEMTSLFATGYGIYKDMYGDLSDMQFGEMFSAGIAASVKNFKTTGSGMAQAISTIGAVATTAKIPMEEQLTILGMLQATMSGSEAGTKYKALMQAAAGAGEKLNLRFVDSNKQLLSMPAILANLKGKYGDTLDAIEKMEIQKAFGTQEAVAVIDLLYGKVGALTDNTQSLAAAMRTGTGFTEQMAMTMNKDIGSGIALMKQRTSNFLEVIGKQLIPVLSPVFSWIGRGIKLITEFAEKHGTLTRVIVVSLGVISALVFVFGTVAAVLGAVGLMAPNMILGITHIGTAFGFVRGNILKAIASMKFWMLWQKQSLLTFLYAQGGIRAYASTINRTLIPSIWAWVRSTIAGIIPSLSAAIAAVWSFTAALLANPITWVVVGIAVLVGALIFLYKRVEAVRTVINGFLFVLGYIVGTAVRVGKSFLSAICNPLLFVKALFWGAGNIISWVTNKIQQLTEKFNWLKPVLNAASTLLSLFVFPPLAIAMNWDAIKTGVQAALNWIRGLIPSFLEAGSKLWDALVTGIKAKLLAPVEIVKGGLAKVRNLLPFSDAKEGPLSQLTLSGARIMETLGAGVQASVPAMKNAVAGALAGVMIASPVVAAPDITGELAKPAAIVQNTAILPQQLKVPAIPDLSAQAMWESREINLPKTPNLSGNMNWSQTAVNKQQDATGISEGRKNKGNLIIQGDINLTLPGVTDAESFVEQLRQLVEGYDV
ncbi:MAG: phage tail tape measure protein [Desulfobacterales bacterium]|nr:phage tail tape measure protein [Desulfobacterales bacterium]